MKNLLIYLICFVAFLFIGCEKDIIGEAEEPIRIEQEPVELKLGNISGIVFDENNEPLENAEIEYSREPFSTDINGYFKINNTGAASDGGLIKINKDGYFENFKFIFLETQQTSHLRIQLIEKNNGQSLSGINGGVINVEGGGKITFPERSLVDENNVSFEGDATVYTHWYNPDDNYLTESMPGDLRGISKESKLVQLSTYGMMAVEIFSSNGQKLNLAEGKSASIEFPLPTSLSNNAPAEIATWSLDEETGVWIEEATAQLSYNSYLAEVTHFSFWNCDIPANLIKLKGQVVNPDGLSLPWYKVLITVKNSGICRAGYTNSNGVFCGYVPKNTVLIIQIKDECGGTVYEEEIGPYGVDTDLGLLELSNTAESQTEIKGSLRCEGLPIPNGYAKITLANGVIYIAETDDNGNYSIFVEGCGLNQATVQGFDIEDNRTSGIVTVNLSTSEGVAEIVPFEVCQELDEFIRWKQNGGNEELFDAPSAKIIDGNLEIVAQLPINIVHTSIILTIPNIATGDNSVSELISTIVNNNNTIDGRCGDDELITCENVTANISTLGGLGDYVVGTFMGEVANTDGVSEPIMGDFRIRINQIVESSAVSGVVWADDNEDGIRQSDESPLAGVQVQMADPAQNTLVTVTNNEGEYSFDRIFNSQIFLEVELEAGFQISTANQGTDDSVDSDFETNPHEINFATGEKIENFDVGIHTDGELICEVEVIEYPICPGNNPFALVGVSIERGTPPYSVEFNNDLVANTNDLTFEIPDVPIGGVIQYTISDSGGNSCSGEFSLELIDAFACFVESTNASGGQDNGTATVVSTSDIIETALWSNGQTDTVITGLSPGTYTVTVTSPNGCTSDCEVTIEEDDLSCEIIGPEVACEPGFTYDLFVETNQSDVTFLWNDNSTGQELNPTVNNTTSFSVIVTNSNGTSTTCEKTIELSSGIECTVEDSTIGCGQSGELTVNATGGQPPYNYSWANGSTSQTTQFFQPGVYSVTVSDTNGCIGVCEGVIEEEEGISCTISTTTGDCGTDDSSAIVEVVGGSGDYSYAWSNGANTQEVLNLASAVYTVTVTDNVTGCSTICEAQITSSIPLEAEIVFEQTCDAPEYFTNMIVLATGGSGSYTYEWSNGSTEAESFTDILETYQVTVTDSQGCTIEAEIQLTPSASTIGNFVWRENDSGQPDVYDVGIEQGIQNVSLLLYNSDPNGILTLIDSTFTDVEGFYEFSNIPAGDYIVEIGVPNNMQLVQPYQAVLEDFDSNFDPITRRTELIIADGCEINTSIDAGLREN